MEDNYSSKSLNIVNRESLFCVCEEQHSLPVKDVAEYVVAELIVFSAECTGSAPMFGCI